MQGLRSVAYTLTYADNLADDGMGVAGNLNWLSGLLFIPICVYLMSYSLLVCLFRYCYRYTKKTKTTATSLSASQAGGDDDIYSHQTLSLGSKYIKKCVSFLVYLEPKKRVWWLQMS